MNEVLIIDRPGPVAWLTLNRPGDGNSIDVALAEALLAAAIELGDDPAVRCLVLTGAGRIFCAGGDIRSFAVGDTPAKAIHAITSKLHPAIEALAALPKPIVTLVNGPAAGAGLGLALLGDVVLAAASAHFTSAYTAIGLTPDGGTSWLLPRLIGLRRATEMVLTNRRIGADEAERIGLISQKVEDANLADSGAQIADRLAASAFGALGASRQLLSAALDHGLAEHLAIEARTIAERANLAEGREGIASFLERRPPCFDGV